MTLPDQSMETYFRVRGNSSVKKITVNNDHSVVTCLGVFFKQRDKKPLARLGGKGPPTVFLFEITLP